MNENEEEIKEYKDKDVFSISLKQKAYFTSAKRIPGKDVNFQDINIKKVRK